MTSEDQNNQDNNNETPNFSNSLASSFQEGMSEVFGVVLKNLGRIIGGFLIICLIFIGVKYFLGIEIDQVMDQTVTPLLGGAIAGFGTVYLISIIPALAVNPIIGVPIGIIVFLIIYAVTHANS
jgi:hypothetical protein